MKLDDLKDLRLEAEVSSVFRGVEDHGIHTVNLYLTGPNGKGWGQAFGNLCLGDDEMTRVFLKEVCDVFGVADPEMLKGRRCFALYSKFCDTIEGIEVDGRRLTIRGFTLRHFPKNARGTPTQEERRRLRERAAWARREAERAEIALAALGELLDWETAPSWDVLVSQCETQG